MVWLACWMIIFIVAWNGWLGPFVILVTVILPKIKACRMNFWKYQNASFQLQEAFAAGLLKPGLNSVQEVTKKRPKINNVAGLKQKLDEFRQHCIWFTCISCSLFYHQKYRQDKLPWIERLDMVNAPAPLAPELAYEEDQGHQEQRHHVLYLYHLSTFIKCIDLGPFLH